MAALIRVVSSGAPTIEVNFSTRRQLVDEYGDGRLLDEHNLVILEDDIPAGQYTYILGFPPDIVSAFRELSLSKTLFSDADADVTPSTLLEELISTERSTEWCKAVGEFASRCWSASEDWMSGLLEAVKNDDLRGLAEYISSSAPPPNAKIEYPNAVFQAMVKSWTGPYKDPARVLDYLFHTLNGYSLNWLKNSSYLAAWTAVIQSSGWGKSRTLCELHTKGVYVVYISFMPEWRRGYPSGTPAASLLTDVQPRSISVWLVALLTVMVNSGMTATEWMQWQSDDSNKEDMGKQVQESTAELFADIQKAPAVVLGNGEWDDPSLRDWMERKVTDLFKKKQWLQQKGELKVLIVLDEVGCFFSSVKDAFVNTRRAFSCIPRNSGIFGVVTDTTAKLGLFSPQRSMYDPSSRFLHPGVSVFSPIWLVGICCNNSKKLLETLAKAISGENPCFPTEEASRELFKWGRPLWRSVLDQKVRLDDVVDFACQKLLQGLSIDILDQKPTGGPSIRISGPSNQIAGPSNQTVDRLPAHPRPRPTAGPSKAKDPPPKLTDSTCMAILSVVAGLEVAAFSELASDMVAANMRTATYISKQQDRVYSVDVLEPILGEAAARLLDRPGVLIDVLKAAVRICKDAFVVEGPRGELVGRLCLVLAIHKCCNETPGGDSFNLYSRPVKACDFLTQLCGQPVQAEGLVCFNRCIILNRQTFTQRLLLICFACSVCIMPDRNQEAFDILVPKLMPGPDGKYELREGRMEAIPIQIRNRDTYSVNTTRLIAFAEYFKTFDAALIRNYVPTSTKVADSDPSVSAEVTPSSTDKKSSYSLRERTTKRKIEELSDDIEEFSDYEEQENPRSRQQDKDDQMEYYGDEMDDDEMDDDEKDNKSSKNELKNELKSLGHETSEPVLGVYLHLRGKSKSKTVEQKGSVLVVHGIRIKGLSDNELKKLEDLRVAFFKLQDCYVEDKRADEVIRKLLPNYLRPRYPASLGDLSTLCLRRELETFGCPTSGLKEILVNRLGVALQERGIPIGIDDLEVDFD